VLRPTKHGFLDRIGELSRHLAGVGLGCDIFPYTESELDDLRREGSALVRAADREGIVLARREGSRQGEQPLLPATLSFPADPCPKEPGPS